MIQSKKITGEYFLKVLCFFLSLFSFYAFFSFSESLKNKFYSAKEGSYIVFENQNITSCLIFHSIENNLLYLYEISQPSSNISNSFCFKSWLNSKPVDSSSFVLYAIDLSTHKIEDCFSFIQNSYINISEQSHFLPKLLNLDLKVVSEHERKKICPKAGHISEKPTLWNPPKVVDGKKIAHPSFEVFQTHWPLDDSELSNKSITLYFDQDNTSFPFPYWIELGDGYINYKIRAKDSGLLHDIPFDFFPKKPLEIVSFQKDHHKNITISIKNANLYDKFQILASASFDGTHFTHLLEHNVTREEKITHLNISKETLDTILLKEMSYHLCIFPEKEPSLCIELKEHLTSSSL